MIIICPNVLHKVMQFKQIYIMRICPIVKRILIAIHGDEDSINAPEEQQHLTPSTISSVAALPPQGFASLRSAHPHCARPRILGYSDSLLWAGTTYCTGIRQAKGLFGPHLTCLHAIHGVQSFNILNMECKKNYETATYKGRD